jgi:hypothetical protein
MFGFYSVISHIGLQYFILSKDVDKQFVLSLQNNFVKINIFCDLSHCRKNIIYISPKGGDNENIKKSKNFGIFSAFGELGDFLGNFESQLEHFQ